MSAAGLKLQPDSGLSILLTDTKTTSSATKDVAASSAMLPLVTAQTVASERGSEDQIRRVLTERAVQASDKRARFVGLAAYEAAGGNTTPSLLPLISTASARWGRRLRGRGTLRRPGRRALPAGLDFR